MIATVVTTPQAEEDIRQVDGWWVRNRGHAPNLFFEELAESIQLLSLWPEIGRKYPCPGLPSIRRVLLRASKYHVYYTFDGITVTILTVWSAIRRRGPRLAPR